MANVLEDLLPEAPRERAALLLAAQAGAAQALREHVTQGIDPGTAINLAAASLEATSPLDPGACRWVVTELAIAIGLVTPADFERHDSPIEASLPSDRPEPATVPAAGTLAQPTQPSGASGADPPASGAVLSHLPLTTDGRPANHAAPGLHRAKPAAAPQAGPTTMSSGDYPPLGKRFWHVVAYLLPAVTFGYGILLLPFLMFKRDRLIRTNAIQSALVALTAAPTITFGIVAAQQTASAPATILAILSGITAVVPISLLLYCLVSVAKHRQPRIRLLTKFARRLAYGTS